MKIAIVAPSPVPFTLGGAERLWSGLGREINEATAHDAELIKLPTREHTLPDLVSSYRAFSQLDLSHFDLAISTKYPAWLANHPNHVVYLQHKLRGLYDTYWMTGLPLKFRSIFPDLNALRRLIEGPPRAELLDEVFGRFDDVVARLGEAHPVFRFPGPLARSLVHWLDAVALHPERIRRYFAISRTVARRPDYFPAGVPVGVVHHPSDLQGLRCGRFDYFFSASRLDGPKRFDLLVAAARRASVPLKIVGTGPDLDRLRSLSADNPEIEFLGYVSSAQLVDLYADALAVPFVPLDEDLGLITLEAMASGKPVITCTDSGGPNEFVRDGVNGLVTAPDAEALAAALWTLARQPDTARRMGMSAQRRAASVTWGATVRTLLGQGPRPLASGAASRSENAMLVAVTTFPVHPRKGGGQLRCFHLYRALATHFDVELISLAPHGVAPLRMELAPGLHETSIPMSAPHAHREGVMTAEVEGMPLTDVLAGVLAEHSPEHLHTLASALRRACAVVMSHPFYHPTVRALAPTLPIIYDAQDVEFQLKASVLPSSDLGRRIQRLVHELEASAVRDSVLIAACSGGDAHTLADEFAVEPQKFLVIPNGVDTRSIRFVTAEVRYARSARWRSRFQSNADPRAAFRHTALFIGSWHPPNLDAAASVLELALVLPDVLFLLVGSQCEFFRERRVPQNVLLLGVLSDAVKDGLLSSADIALNPLRYGSGTNLKIVEYFAAGVPVVSTPLGARGLDVQDGTHLAIAPLDTFAAAVRHTLDNPTAASAMAERARALVEEQYDWTVLGGRLTHAVIERLHLSPRHRPVSETLGTAVPSASLAP